MAGISILSLPTLPPGMGLVIMWMLIIFVLLGPLTWAIWWMFTYKHKIKIKEDRSGVPFYRVDTYRYKNFKGTEILKLWKSKTIIPKPGLDYIRREGNKDVIEYYRAKDGHYYPRRIEEKDESTLAYKYSNREAEYWSSLRTREALINWNTQSVWEKWMAPLSVFMVAFIFIIGMYITWGGVADAVAPINAAVSQLAHTNSILEATLNHSIATTPAPVGGIVYG